MRVLIFDDPAFDEHHQGPGHPESPARLVAVRAALAGRPWIRRRGRPATVEELCTVHAPAYVDAVLATDGRPVVLDPDVSTSAGSVRAARRAAGAALDAADALVRGEPGFVLCRPPGHHATPDRAMGFCIFNNAALAAHRLTGRDGDGARRRVLVFDPDVHHGNGTQDIFWQRDDVLYVSLHRAPFYPGSGAETERGAGPGAGLTVNVELPAGAGDDVVLAAFFERALPAIEDFDPEYCVISAGYDALAGDPLGGMRLSIDGLCRMWAPIVAAVPTMAVLEGGYDPPLLGRAVAATADLLAGDATGRRGPPGVRRQPTAP
ncbi:MAG: histone deacetylase [Deltaproteobacteria bacterium]|nr:MAG: histone deacetylase [Deltaproteobacteria bacterium]